jgi:hypothetical protein
MISDRLANLLKNLKKGLFSPDDVAFLEQIAVKDLVEELHSVYRLTLQERLVGQKCELSLARSLRLIAPLIPNSMLGYLTLRLVPDYLDCIMISAESGQITGVSRSSRLRIRQLTKPEPALELRTGRGHKLDKMPDGWSMKPLAKRTIRLSEPFLRERGWKFDLLRQSAPIS